MTMTNTQRRAAAYNSGQDQLIDAVEKLLNHLKENRKAPEKIVAHNLSELRQAYYKIQNVADAFGLELMALEL